MSEQATRLSEAQQEMEELFREMKRDVMQAKRDAIQAKREAIQAKRIMKQLQPMLFSRFNKPFSWSVRRFGARSERSKGHLKQIIASCRTAVNTPVASTPSIQAQASMIRDNGTGMKSKTEAGTSNRLNNQTTQASDKTQKLCGSGCVNYTKLPLITLPEQDRLRPQIVGTFLVGKNDDGSDRTITLNLIQNGRSTMPRHWYPVIGSLHATKGGKSSCPLIMTDNGATSSLVSRSVAEETGWSADNPDNVKHRERFKLPTGAMLQSIGTWNALLNLHESGRWSWVEFAVVEDEDMPVFAVVEDEDLPYRWQALLSHGVCHDASLLAYGPSTRSPCACVRDWRTPYISKPILPMSPKPELIRVQTITPDIAVAPAGTRNGA